MRGKFFDQVIWKQEHVSPRPCEWYRVGEKSLKLHITIGDNRETHT